MFLMQVPTQAQPALPGVELRPGLEVAEVHALLAQGLQLRDSGNRILAFYLTEMDARRLHQASGHASTVHFAEEVLGLDRRRTGELLSVGRKLLTLPAIDDAFLRGELCWTKVVQLMRVASPEHEAAWLARALQSSTRALRMDVARTKQGAAPRAAGDSKGLPEIRFRIDMQVSALTHNKFDLAKQKLAAERGAAVADADDRVDQVLIVTPDKDLGQCVRGDRVVQFDRRKREILDEAAIVSSAEIIGITHEVFQRTVEYLKVREQFGVRIGTFQALKHRAAAMFCEVELSQSIVLDALRAIDEGRPDVARLASAAKAKCSDTASLVTCEGLQMHGGIGMTDEEEIGLFLKRAKAAELSFGDAFYHRDRFARLTSF